MAYNGRGNFFDYGKSVKRISWDRGPAGFSGLSDSTRQIGRTK